MSFGAMLSTTPSKDTAPAQVAVNYLVAIDQLSARNAPEAREEVQVSEQLSKLDQFSGYLIYMPVIIFALLFVTAFIFQMLQRAKTLKNISMAIVIAVFAAGIPTMLTMTQGGVHQSAKAGPEEVPREVRVQKTQKGGVVVIWATDAVKIGSVRISKKSIANASPRVFVGNDQVPVKNHIVNIPALTMNQIYTLEILSGTTWYDNGGKPVEFVYR